MAEDFSILPFEDWRSWASNMPSVGAVLVTRKASKNEIAGNTYSV